MKFSLDESGYILKFENVQLIDRSNPKSKSTGTLYLTTSHLVFVESNTKQELWIYYSLISLVDKQPLNISGSPLLIKCKHFLTCLFVVGKERDCQTLNSTLLQFSRPSKYKDLLCFKESKHLEFLKEAKNTANSQQYLDSEYARMGVPNNYWKLSDMNANYEMCDTYPSKLYVPASATDQLLKGSAGFRSRGRLPVLSYLHPNGASITRCAQPLTGFNGRSVEDEQLLQLILFTNENSKTMYVIDTRPKINALANKAQGKGFENENNYTNINFHFIGIENIHVMRNSQQKLVECSDVAYTGSFLTGLDKSEWIKHIRAIMETSLFIADAVEIEKTSVLVHCSDGWDRTAQTCAFASLLLDPYYRSLHGFQILIEKEWLTFGHKFSHRCGHLYENENSLKETSPIFTQFLESTWQLTQQFPCAFEFNERLLVRLHEHAYSCQFGTFIGNCEKERLELKLEETTVSFWDYVQHRISDFLNPLYVPNSDYASQVLRPDCRIQSLKFWRSLYNRFDPTINPTEKMSDALSMLKNNTTCLNEYSKLLEKRCSQLRSLINEKSDPLSENNKPIEKNGDQQSELESNLESMKISNGVVEESTHDHPLTHGGLKKTASGDLSLDKLSLDYNSIELNWKSSRKNCTCSESLDSSFAKLNCTRCGEIYCERCSENGKQMSMNNSGSSSSKLVFICSNCLKSFVLE